DLMLPDMDGNEVIKRLRANAEIKHTPVIMFTAKTVLDDQAVRAESGADDYLTKPTHPAEAASRVKAVLARGHVPHVPNAASVVPQPNPVAQEIPESNPRKAEVILIGDDDLDSLKLIGLMIQRQGYQVITAMSGAQTLGKATHDQPDLIILDVM